MKLAVSVVTAGHDRERIDKLKIKTFKYRHIDGEKKETPCWTKKWPGADHCP